MSSTCAEVYEGVDDLATSRGDVVVPFKLQQHHDPEDSCDTVVLRSDTQYTVASRTAACVSAV